MARNREVDPYILLDSPHEADSPDRTLYRSPRDLVVVRGHPARPSPSLGDSCA